MSIITYTDSYKFSQPFQYPPGTQIAHSHILARGGKYPEVLFFGLQMFLRKYLCETITESDVSEAAGVCEAHGVPFFREGWMRIVRESAGRLPLLIQAVPEGTVVPTGNILVTVENTVLGQHWLTRHIEAALLHGVWYPTSVATVSKNIYEILRGYYEKTSDNLDGYLFGLHDFGLRAATCLEAAEIAGPAHLVNFLGTDNVPALLSTMKHYNCKMPGKAPPASEHSTMTAWGRERELDAYRNMLKQFAKPGSVVAIVSDSYDIYYACENLWGGALREEVIASGATIVIRPDSGDPCTVVPLLVAILDSKFGHKVNSKGFKVLNHVRLIWGDGINSDVIRKICEILLILGYSVENINFGMGHELLNAVKRDTEGFKMAASAVYINGQWHDSYKDPVTDHKKASFKGRMMLYQRPDGTFHSDILHTEINGHGTRMLEPVYCDGKIVKVFTFDDIRKRAASFRMKTI